VGDLDLLGMLNALSLGGNGILVIVATVLLRRWASLANRVQALEDDRVLKVEARVADLGEKGCPMGQETRRRIDGVNGELHEHVRADCTQGIQAQLKTVIAQGDRISGQISALERLTSSVQTETARNTASITKAHDRLDQHERDHNRRETH